MPEIVGKRESAFNKILDGFGIAASVLGVNIAANALLGNSIYSTFGKVGVGLLGSAIPGKAGSYIAAGGLTAAASDVLSMIFGGLGNSGKSGSNEYLSTIII